MEFISEILQVRSVVYYSPHCHLGTALQSMQCTHAYVHMLLVRYENDLFPSAIFRNAYFMHICVFEVVKMYGMENFLQRTSREKMFCATLRPNPAGIRNSP